MVLLLTGERTRVGHFFRAAVAARSTAHAGVATWQAEFAPTVMENAGVALTL